MGTAAHLVGCLPIAGRIRCVHSGLAGEGAHQTVHRQPGGPSRAKAFPGRAHRPVGRGRCEIRPETPAVTWGVANTGCDPFGVFAKAAFDPEGITAFSAESCAGAFRPMRGRSRCSALFTVGRKTCRSVGPPSTRGRYAHAHSAPARSFIRLLPSLDLGGLLPQLLLRLQHLLQAVAHVRLVETVQVGLPRIHPGGVPETAHG